MSLLMNVSLFDGLDDNELKAIEGLCQRRNYPKNSILINEGDESNSLYIIESGRVKVFVSDTSGKEFVLNTMGPGAEGYFGELALLDDERRSASVITVEKSILAIIYKADFERILEEHPSISLKLLKNLTRKVRSLTDSIKSLALKDVYGRIKKLFDDLAVDEDGELTVSEKLTQQEIANRVGSSREMVARILKDLIMGGYINNESKKIKITKDLPESY